MSVMSPASSLTFHSWPSDIYGYRYQVALDQFIAIDFMHLYNSILPDEWWLCSGIWRYSQTCIKESPNKNYNLTRSLSIYMISFELFGQIKSSFQCNIRMFSHNMIVLDASTIRTTAPVMIWLMLLQSHPSSG